MKPIQKFALIGLFLAGTAGYVAAQTAETAPAPETQTADRSDGQGWGWWGHGGKHGRGHSDGMGDEMGGEHHGGGRMMQMIDANGDGAIGEDEAAAMADRMFQHLDENNDGTVDKAEFTTPQHRGGGMRSWLGLGTDEAAAVQKVREEKFVALDADKDGKLTKAEFFAEAKAKLAAADTDKDGKVSPWEFRAAN